MERLEISAHGGVHLHCFFDVEECVGAVAFSVEFGLMRAFGALYAIFDFFGASM